MRPVKFWIVIILLLSSIIYCFAFPKAKYVSTNILPQLRIPYKMAGWQGKDVTEELNLDDERYNFISQVFAREYVNSYGENLLLLILDAGNFHHPKVCFSSSGFKIRELNNPEFHILNRKFKGHCLYAQKPTEGFLVIYWICIDKKIVDWTEQKIKQLWFSLFKKERVGLMIRLDMPTREGKIESSLTVAKDFIDDLSQTLASEQVDYIFGSPQ